MGWKNLDAEQFAETYLDFLKDLCKACTVRKSELRSSLRAAKMGLSPAECDLSANKVHESISYCRRRLRDRGSGIYLPQSCKALLKIWAKVETPTQKEKPAKKAAEPEEEKSIRDVFGLKKKEKDVPMIDVDSGDEEEDEPPDPAPGSSRSQHQPLGCNKGWVAN